MRTGILKRNYGGKATTPAEEPVEYTSGQAARSHSKTMMEDGMGQKRAVGLILAGRVADG